MERAELRQVLLEALNKLGDCGHDIDAFDQKEKELTELRARLKQLNTRYVRQIEATEACTEQLIALRERYSRLARRAAAWKAEAAGQVSVQERHDQIVSIIAPHADGCQDPDCSLCEDAIRRADLLIATFWPQSPSTDDEASFAELAEIKRREDV